MITVVTFDLDNTLWDVEGVIEKAERVTRDWFDRHVPELHQRFMPEDFRILRAQIAAEDARLAHDVSRMRREVFRRAISSIGYRDDEAQRLATEAFEVFLNERHRVELFAEALPLLETLVIRYRLGALTNGNADIGRLGLNRYFSFAFSAASVGASKPHPAMFRAALEHASVVPSQMVHIGDHPVDDIEGASSLGIHTIWVNPKRIAYPVGAPPTRRAEQLDEIPRILAEIEAQIA
jgi:FMN hydrolase / 5-amino-6-(5-phospho-D-ribitylamino)uracil phosphatase